MSTVNVWLRIRNLVNIVSSLTASQDAHKRLVLQVYLGSNTLEFSAIRS